MAGSTWQLRQDYFDQGPKDPIVFRGGDTNLYSYVGADPVSHRDPTGLRPLRLPSWWPGFEIPEDYNVYPRDCMAWDRPDPEEMAKCLEKASEKGLKCWHDIGSACMALGIDEHWTNLYQKWTCYFQFLDEALRCAGCNDRIV